MEQHTIGPVATRGAAPPEQSFAAKDARAPIVFSLSGFDLLDQHIAARVAEFHDHVVVQHNGCALVGVSEVFHAHRDELTFGTCVSCSSRDGRGFGIGAPNEVVSLLLPRDCQSVPGTVENAKTREEAIPEL